MFYVLAETITATRKELAENGIELPKFQKIAGLLSEDVKGDTLTLHEAIIEINNAVVSKVIKYLINLIFILYSINNYVFHYNILGYELFY